MLIWCTCDPLLPPRLFSHRERDTGHYGAFLASTPDLRRHRASFIALAVRKYHRNRHPAYVANDTGSYSSSVTIWEILFPGREIFRTVG